MSLFCQFDFSRFIGSSQHCKKRGENAQIAALLHFETTCVLGFSMTLPACSGETNMLFFLFTSDRSLQADFVFHPVPASTRFQPRNE